MTYHNLSDYLLSIMKNPKSSRMSKKEAVEAIDKIYADAEAEGRELTQSEVEEMDRLTDIAYGY